MQLAALLLLPFPFAPYARFLVPFVGCYDRLPLYCSIPGLPAFTFPITGFLFWFAAFPTYVYRPQHLVPHLAPALRPPTRWDYAIAPTACIAARAPRWVTAPLTVGAGPFCVRITPLPLPSLVCIRAIPRYGSSLFHHRLPPHVLILHLLATLPTGYIAMLHTRPAYSTFHATNCLYPIPGIVWYILVWSRKNVCRVALKV